MKGGKRIIDALQALSSSEPYEGNMARVQVGDEFYTYASVSGSDPEEIIAALCDGRDWLRTRLAWRQRPAPHEDGISVRATWIPEGEASEPKPEFGPAGHEIMFQDVDGWSEWIHPQRGYQMSCCDCNLVHNMEFAIVPSADVEGFAPEIANDGEGDSAIIFRASRA